MSVTYRMPSSFTPLQRPTETINSTSSLHSKCGEIYVTQDWNKWTYNCALCQLYTSDIGVFICHIRLHHSNGQHNSGEAHNPNDANVSHNSNVLNTNTISNTILNDNPTGEPHPMKIIRNSTFVIDEVSEFVNNNQNTSPNTNPQTILPSIIVNNGAICSTVPKIINAQTLNKSGRDDDNNGDGNSNEEFSQTNEEFLEISSSESESVTEVQDNNAANQDNDDINDLSNFLHCNLGVDGDTTSTTTTAVIDITKRFVKRKKLRKHSNASYQHKCPKCPNRFKTKQGVNLHYVKIHDKNFHLSLPHKCDICFRGFTTTSSLNIHKIKHNKDKHFICPVCKETKYREYLYVDHMQTHASDVCFPCYACGEIYPNDEERMRHWKTHAIDKPFVCEFCFRRYRLQPHLLQHLKAHNRYQCNLCSEIFRSEVTKRFPYTCPQCEQMSDIKEKIENLQSSHNNTSPNNDSDIEFI